MTHSFTVEQLGSAHRKFNIEMHKGFGLEQVLQYLAPDFASVELQPHVDRTTEHGRIFGGISISGIPGMDPQFLRVGEGERAMAQEWTRSDMLAFDIDSLVARSIDEKGEPRRLGDGMNLLFADDIHDVWQASRGAAYGEFGESHALWLDNDGFYVLREAEANR